MSARTRAAPRCQLGRRRQRAMTGVFDRRVPSIRSGDFKSRSRRPQRAPPVSGIANSARVVGYRFRLLQRPGGSPARLLLSYLGFLRQGAQPVPVPVPRRERLRRQLPRQSLRRLQLRQPLPPVRRRSTTAFRAPPHSWGWPGVGCGSQASGEGETR